MNFSMLENFLKFILLLKLQLAVLSSQKESMWLSKIVTPGNLASLGKRSIVTVFVHLAETMKRIFISLSRYWQKQYVNDSN